VGRASCRLRRAALRLYDAALRARISLAPGPLFSARGCYDTCIRLNAAVWDETRQAGIATLGRLAGKVLRQAR
jgi:DNA-binding transcriptional MocR family regulator